ncbi:MAG: glycoside hydrolase family 27 protein [Bacteroidota bacterium]|nr:glycoside hydrolase family 27 protein [Bacteroidota bacterium]
MKKILIIKFIVCLTLLTVSAQSFDELAKTPPMGWNSWNKFGCDVSETLIKEMADAMVSSSMRDAGYQYIVIDDCWQIDRDSSGYIIADPERFPSGIKALADYIHKLGLKFGIYSCAGSKTCQGRPGSRGHQFQDAMQYAAWGVDYLKYDWCHNEGQNAKAAYKTMSDALKTCGRPIVFSICEWGRDKPWEWGKGIGHLWRTTPDIRNMYQGKVNWGGLGIVDIIDRQADLWKYAGPGHWNDPDMLEVGNKGLTRDENVTHFSMWAMLAAPLMAGNDLRNMSADVKKILTNKEVIAINQDPLGKQAIRWLDMGNKEVWVKFLKNDELAICFMNRSDFPWKENYNWERLNIYHGGKVIKFKKMLYTIRDLWKHKGLKTTQKFLELNIPSHGVLMVKLTPVKQ